MKKSAADKKDYYLGILQIVLSGFLYGCLGFFGTKLLDDHLPMSNMLFWRFFTAALWMLPYLKIDKWRTGKSKWGILIPTLGSLSYGSSTAFYFLAAKSTGTGLAMVIFFAYPLFVIAFAWYLERRPIRLAMLLSIMIIILGLVLLKGNKTQELSFIGILLGLLSGLCYALYVYGSQHSSKVLSADLQTFLVCIGCSAIFLIYSLFVGNWVWPATPHTWFYIACVGIFATAFPIQLMLKGLEVIDSGKASILSVLEPLVTVMIGVVALDESLSALQVFGVVIVLLGALLIQFEK